MRTHQAQLTARSSHEGREGRESREGRRESREGHESRQEPYRHPYGAVPAQRRAPDSPARTPVAAIAPAPLPEAAMAQRLREIREMSSQAIGSIDDLLSHSA